MSPPKVFIQHLRLTGFRSYPALDIEPGSGPVVFFGQNGAGKTNILEAVSLLSPGRGLRKAQTRDLFHTQDEITAASWGIVAGIETPNGEVKAASGDVPGAPTRRQVRIDSKQVSALDLARMVSVMWLTPAQDGLFTGGASDRRGFLDRFVMAHLPDHGRHSNIYEKARRERNRLFSDDIRDDRWCEILERKMASSAAEIARGRVQTLDRLSAEIENAPDTVFPKARIHIEGRWEDLARDNSDINDLAQQIFEDLKEARMGDRRAGRTRFGIHKSDMVVYHAQKNMLAALSSTGEQKALLTGLFLAQARALLDRAPILLLDEIGAHLDPVRRAALSEHVLDLGLQTWMTGTDRDLFEGFEGKAKIFEVLDGQVGIV